MSPEPNITVAPLQRIHNSIEIVYQSLNPTDAEELRTDIPRILKQSKPPKPNLTREEWKALKQLKSDKDHITLTADKGVALVVMERSEDIKKMKKLLEDTITYRSLYMDPSNKQKNKLINILRRIKTESAMEDTTYRKMYPTEASSPKLYGLPKIHKRNTP